MMKEYSLLQENWRTDLLKKSRLLRNIYGGALKFTQSKYLFPIAMDTYGLATITLPSGSMYTIALGHLPVSARKKVLKQLRHAKSGKDALKILGTLKDEGIKVVKSVKEKITDTTERLIAPKTLNLMKYQINPMTYLQQLER